VGKSGRIELLEDGDMEEDITIIVKIQDGRWCEIEMAEDRDGWRVYVVTEILTEFCKSARHSLG